MKVRDGKGQHLNHIVRNYCVIDIETTGLAPSDSEIIEFTGLKVRNGEIIDTFSTLIKPHFIIPSFITNLTGISNQMVQNADPIQLVMPQIINYLEGEILLGHNINFDINFLYDIAMNLFGYVFDNNYVDLLKIVRKLYCDWENHKLSTVAYNLGLSNIPGHRAEKDCLTTYEAYEKCLQYIYLHNIDYDQLFNVKKYHKRQNKKVS